MISIIIPLYNKEKEIARAIKSVLSQSFSEFELIVVDDGSTDKSLAVVKTFSDKKIKILTKQNGGVSSARNLGIMEAKYDWIALLDGDDWCFLHLKTIPLFHFKSIPLINARLMFFFHC